MQTQARFGCGHAVEATDDTPAGQASILLLEGRRSRYLDNPDNCPRCEAARAEEAEARTRRGVDVPRVADRRIVVIHGDAHVIDPMDREAIMRAWDTGASLPT